MNRTKKRLVHFAVAVGLIALGVLGMRALTASKPQLEKRKPPPAPAPMVRTIRIKAGPQVVHILGEGTVRSLREISLVPQVGGKVVFVSPALVNGGEFSKGDTLLRIDPVDYHLAVTLAKAKVKDAESRLELAKEEASAAQEEWRLLHEEGAKANIEPPPLVAKEPQLAAARAKLEADQADLSKALLNLERTEIKAPFDGRVSQKHVDIGQHVLIGQTLAILYSTEAAEIVVPLEDESAFWFHIPGFTPGNSPGSPAKVLASIAGRERIWPATVVRAEGKLDERTRMINVVVRVEKPYAKKPPLVMGLFVTVNIQGRSLPNAAIIPRSALRQDDLVWVVDKHSRLHFRKVDVALVQGDDAVIQAGLEEGERLVTTPLKAFADGMAVRPVPGTQANL
ncbi:MAG: efflux RND transporter periplasmic adaptor subunit [Deltaproteobacteria bacterium]|nr:efflux RND transporter periplasmic adaptor subunit [Deltaproteobacteria bacterium]